MSFRTEQYRTNPDPQSHLICAAAHQHTFDDLDQGEIGNRGHQEEKEEQWGQRHEPQRASERRKGQEQSNEHNGECGYCQRTTRAAAEGIALPCG